MRAPCQQFSIEISRNVEGHEEVSRCCEAHTAEFTAYSTKAGIMKAEAEGSGALMRREKQNVKVRDVRLVLGRFNEWRGVCLWNGNWRHYKR